MSSSADAWRAYDAEVRRAAVPAGEFEQRGYHVGMLPAELAGRLAAMLRVAPPIPFRNTDFTPGFQASAFDEATISMLNRTSTYRALDNRASWAMAEALDALKEPVAACLATPWRTVNVRAWTTHPGAEKAGPYGWHTDGFVSELFKIMLYLTTMSAEDGALEIDGDGVITGAAGTWVLFKNSELRHRGLPGRTRERIAVEITLCRSPVFDTRPRYPGLNAQWPLYPWVEAFDGCPKEHAQHVAERSDTARLGLRFGRRIGTAAILAGLHCVAAVAPLVTPLGARVPIAARILGKVRQHADANTLPVAAGNIWRYIESRFAR